MGVLEVIVSVIVALAVGFGGGWITSDLVDAKKPPKTLVQHITQVQQVEQRQTTLQQSAQVQVQVTAVTTSTQMHAQVQVTTATQVSVSVGAKTNHFSRTNINR